MPIVLLALVFNVTNVVGFTYADRDSKRKWASGMAASSMFGSIGGVGGSIVSELGELSHYLSFSTLCLKVADKYLRCAVRGGISKVLG